MEGRQCYRCRRFGRSFAFDRAWGSFYYAGWIQRLLWAGKFRPAPGIFPALATLCQLDWPLGMTRVVPVPGHPRHRRARGFSPTRVLARSVAAFTHLPMTPGLHVHHPGAPQQSLGQEQRLLQAKSDRFRWEGPSLEQETVLLVDDVMTTGATAHAAARALKQAGAERVWVWTVAQEVPRASIPALLNRFEPSREVQA